MLDHSDIKKQVSTGLNTMILENDGFKNFYETILNMGEVFLVGGAVRDFALRRNPKDLDLIIDCKNADLLKIIDSYVYRKNRFGGFKLAINDIEIDIWIIANHWAFKEELYECSFENISKGAFFNFDAITLSLKSYKLDADTFIEAYNNKYLDINLNEFEAKLNPTPEKNINKAYKLKESMDFELSERLKGYCNNWENNKVFA